MTVPLVEAGGLVPVITPDSPTGTIDHSPPLQRWVSRLETTPSPAGAKEARRQAGGVLSSRTGLVGCWPRFPTLEESCEFWDTHSVTEYEEFLEPVEVEVDLASPKIYCPVAKDLLLQVRQQVRKQGVSTETLINLWLQERLHASA